MKCVYFLIACLLGKPGFTQVPANIIPAPYTMIGVYSAHFMDVFSFTVNQAALAHTKQPALGLHTERKYMLKELKRVALATTFPFLHGGAGMSATYFGFAGYNETHAGIAYGRKLGEKIDLGVQFNYYLLRIPGYGGDGTLTFEIGSLVHLTDKLHIGCHVYNPAGGSFGRNAEEKMASRYSFGTGYEASDKLFISSTIIKITNRPLDVNVSMHYAFVKNFLIRGGINAASASYFAGAGVTWKTCRMDISVASHPQTGITPGIMLIFTVPQNLDLQE